MFGLKPQFSIQQAACHRPTSTRTEGSKAHCTQGTVMGIKTHSPEGPGFGKDSDPSPPFHVPGIKTLGALCKQKTFLLLYASSHPIAVQADRLPPHAALHCLSPLTAPTDPCRLPTRCEKRPVPPEHERAFFCPPLLVDPQQSLLFPRRKIVSVRKNSNRSTALHTNPLTAFFSNATPKMFCGPRGSQINPQFLSWVFIGGCSDLKW